MTKVIEIPAKYFEGLPDDDSGMWRGMKAYFADRKVGRREQAVIWLGQQPEGTWIQHTEYHWSSTLKDKRLDFWPSTGRWQWDGRVYQGDLESFVGFMNKRRKLSR